MIPYSEKHQTSMEQVHFLNSNSMDANAYCLDLSSHPATPSEKMQKACESSIVTNNCSLYPVTLCSLVAEDGDIMKQDADHCHQSKDFVLPRDPALNPADCEREDS
jgi:hypothetical protein